MDEGRSLPPGAIVAGEWRIERVLGQGGFGVTYEARSSKTGAHVALKEYMPSGLCTRPVGATGVIPAPGEAGEIFKDLHASFLKEAETLVRLNHPSIVRVTGYFQANGTAYMTLAYLQGGSLANWLKRLGRRPTQTELDQLLWPITDALTHVHALFVLHRDIKPDNIMLRDSGTPVLIDFGAITSVVSSDTRSIGAETPNFVTDGYAPPEQYVPSDQNLLGPWTDVYALGATVYEAITGQKPPPSPRRVIDDPHRPLATLPLERIGTSWRPTFLQGIDLALALKRSDRPQSAMEFRSAIGLTAAPSGTQSLSKIATELVATSPPPSAFSQLAASPRGKSEVTGRWPSKLGVAAASVLTLVVMLGSGGWYAFTRKHAEEERHLVEVRGEISAATTSVALDRIAAREPRLAPEIAKKRQDLAAIERSVRLRSLRSQIGRETSLSELDRIVVEEPELRTDVEARKAQLAQLLAQAYSKSGSFACFGKAIYPDSWRDEASLCVSYGCNFGKMSQDECLALGGKKRSTTVIHGNKGTTRSNECWLQHSCGDLRAHGEFTLFRM